MRSFGAQLSYVSDVFEAHARPVDAGGGRLSAERRAQLAGQYSRVVMQIIVSLAVLAGGFVLLISGEEQLQKFAAGFVGAVIGYWLK
jgi:hypothetical protein